MYTLSIVCKMHVCVWETVGMCAPWWEGQRTTLGLGSCLLTCLETGFPVHFCVSQVSCEFSCLYLLSPGLQMCMAKSGFIQILGIQTQVSTWFHSKRFIYWAVSITPEHNLTFLFFLFFSSNETMSTYSVDWSGTEASLKFAVIFLIQTPKHMCYHA